MSRSHSTLIQGLALGLVAACVGMLWHSPAAASSTPSARIASPRNEHRTATPRPRRDAPAATIQQADLAADQMSPAWRRQEESQATAAEPVAGVAPMTQQQHGPSPEAAVAQQPAGPPILAIQLATDVRLPAAMVPMGQANLPPAVAAAAVEIGKQFYQNLLADATHPQAGQMAPPQVDDTAMIPNGPITDHLRQAADEMFRVLYGDEKYIQQTLASAIEASLPPEPSGP